MIPVRSAAAFSDLPATVRVLGPVRPRVWVRVAGSPLVKVAGEMVGRRFALGVIGLAHQHHGHAGLFVGEALGPDGHKVRGVFGHNHPVLR